MSRHREQNRVPADGCEECASRTSILPQRQSGCVCAVVVAGLAGTVLLTVSHLLSTDDTHTPKKASHITPAQRARMEKAVSEPSMDEKTRRAEVADAWVASARTIVELTDDAEAKEILQFLGNHAELAMPSQKGILPLTEKNAETFFHFVPLLPGDEESNKLWQGLTRRNAAAWFLPNPGVLVVRPCNMSKIWGGILFLHEARHARQFFTKKLDWKNIAVYCEEERGAHAFQHGLCSKIGGQGYDRLVKNEAQRLETMAKETDLPLSSFIGIAPYDAQLDDMFGKAEPGHEKAHRQVSTWIHAAFLAIERQYPDPVMAAQKQADFLEAVYRKQGLLPSR